MRSIFVLLFIFYAISCFAERLPNELIDYSGFQQLVGEIKDIREERRLTEEQFLEAMKSGEYIILDARSKKNFDLRHIQEAVNLPFTEFTAESLSQVIPSKDTKILIYCNNNFRGSPVSFASKAATASLNLSTQIALAAYGYKHVYELGPLLEVGKTKIPFTGEEVNVPSSQATSPTSQ